MVSMRWVAVLALVGAIGCTGGGFSDGGGFVEEPFPEGFVVDDERPVVLADHAPPPISGGTLTIGRDGRTAIVADPDHDVVWRFDVREIGETPLSGEPIEGLLSATALEPGDEPGRIVEDAQGRIHVVLRGGGAIASFDPTDTDDVRRTAVCSEPRGLAYDAATDRLHVACTNGELVTLPAGGGPEIRRLLIDDDLRDVVMRGDHLLVSRFRSAELVEVDADGAVVARMSLESRELMTGQFTPSVAWRTFAAPDGSIEVVHQRGSIEEVEIRSQGGYSDMGFECGSPIVHAATSRLDAGESAPLSSPFRAGVALPVDAAITSDGTTVAIASAATGDVHIAPREGELGMDEFEDEFDDGAEMEMECFTSYQWRVRDTVLAPTAARQPVAVAFAGDDLIVQVRDPSALMRVHLGHFQNGGYYPESAVATVLPAARVTDSGHQSFHEAASATVADMEMGFGAATLACASCHPEGRDDGRTWSFTEIGARRTQSVAGGILGTEPLHWDGDMDHFDTLVDTVFVQRMGAARPNARRVSAIASWIDSIPAPHPGRPVDLDAAERGRELFEDSEVGCVDCHRGARMTNNQTVDVGTGGAFQVPSLVGVSARAPFLHDGRAQTLRDRFQDGGGDRHGRTSQLTEAQIEDLVAYLQTL